MNNIFVIFINVISDPDAKDFHSGANITEA